MKPKPKKNQLFTKIKEDSSAILSEQALEYCNDFENEIPILSKDSINSEDFNLELDCDFWD